MVMDKMSYVRMYLCMYACVCVCMYMYVCMRAYACVCFVCARVHMCVYIVSDYDVQMMIHSRIHLLKS